MHTRNNQESFLIATIDFIIPTNRFLIHGFVTSSRMPIVVIMIKLWVINRSKVIIFFVFTRYSVLVVLLFYGTFFSHPISRQTCGCTKARVHIRVYFRFSWMYILHLFSLFDEKSKQTSITNGIHKSNDLFLFKLPIK